MRRAFWTIGCAVATVTTAQFAVAQTAQSAVKADVLPTIAAETVIEGIPRPFGLAGGPPRSFSGADYAAGLAMLRRSLPDLRITILSRDTIGTRTVLRLQFSGRFSGAPLLGYKANGALVEFDAIDIIDREAGGKIAKVTTSTNLFALLRAITTAMPVREPVRPLEGETVYRAGPGDFIESLAAEPDGGLLMTLLYTGTIMRLSPDGKTQVIARLPGYRPGSPGFICLIRENEGTVYATVQNQNPAGQPVSQLWRMNLNGEFEEIVTFPPEAQPNGLAFDGRGGIIVGDNLAGLWHVDPARSSVARWSLDPLLTRRDYIGMLPAANGVQRIGDVVYVTNSDRGLLLRLPIAKDGSAGVPTVVASGVPGDDFALDTDGTAYVTTHPHDSVIQVAPDGTSTVIATAAQALAGPTSAVIMKDRGVRYLYVANDGGIFANRPPSDQTPGITRYRLEAAR